MNALDKYLGEGISKVDGFLNSYSARLIARLSARQVGAGIRGALGEIGVHQGRLFILLLLTKVPGEKAFAIDLFEDDDVNIREKTLRSVGILQRHLAKWAPDIPPADIGIIKASSLDVAADELVANYGCARLLSVDGGHDEATVLHDLYLSDKVMGEHGIVIFDDYFNDNWPGVSSAYARYALDDATRFRPFAISPDKLYLADRNQLTFYRNEIRESENAFYVRTQVMFDHDVDIYKPSGSGRAALKKFIQRTPLRRMLEL